MIAKKYLRTWVAGLCVVAVAPWIAMGQDAEIQTELLQNGNASDVRPGQAAPPMITTTPAGGVRGSLFRQGALAPVPQNAEGAPVSGAPVSFISVDAPKPKKFRKNDVVTVIVQQDSQSSTTAQTQSQKQQDFDLALQSWIQLHNSPSGVPNSVTSVGSSGTLPEAKFKYDNNRQNQASQVRADSLSTRVSGTVVDVKPNGTIVIEASAQITVDKEVQVFRISGICRSDDITPDNTILSSQLAELTLSKQTKGEVHDGVKSGWLNNLIDKVNPF